MVEGHTTRVRPLKAARSAAHVTHSHWALFTRLAMIIRGPDHHATVT